MSENSNQTTEYVDLLDLVKSHPNGDYTEVLSNDDRWEVLYNLSPIRQNLVEWMNLDDCKSILEVGAGCGALTVCYAKKAHSIDAIETDDKLREVGQERTKKLTNVSWHSGLDSVAGKLYDVISLVGVDDLQEQLKDIEAFANENTKVIVAIDNKMGLKFLAGAKHTCEKTYSIVEIMKLLGESDFEYSKIYYPFPDYRLPGVIFSQGYKPIAGDIRNVVDQYHENRYVTFDEEVMFDQLIKDGQFEYFANSFLVVASMSEIKMDTVYVKYNRARKPEYQISTKIIDRGKDGLATVKSALGEAAIPHIKRMYENRTALENQHKNLSFADARMCGNDGVEFNYVEGKSLAALQKRLLTKKDIDYDIDHFFERIFAKDDDNEIDTVPFSSSEEFTNMFGDVADKWIGAKSLKKTNIDLIIDNIIVKDNDWYCLDYEWTFDFLIPIDFVKYRTLQYFYNKFFVELQQVYPYEEFMSHWGFDEQKLELCKSMESSFQENVSGGDNYLERYKKVSKSLKDLKDEVIVGEDRQRILKEELDSAWGTANMYKSGFDKWMKISDNKAARVVKKIVRRKK